VSTTVTLCTIDDVWEGAIRQAVLPSGHKLALFNVDGTIYATDDTCTHGAASLSEDGSVDGHFVECAWHNGRFDVRSGQACAMPCTEPLKSWPVRIVDGRVCVDDTHDASESGPHT
jgi:p-cumate 2,3-dioxygenase ferredoxin component